MVFLSHFFQKFSRSLDYTLAPVTLIAESPESVESSPMQHVIIEATAT